MKWPITIRCPHCGREWGDAIEIGWPGVGMKPVACYVPYDPPASQRGCGHEFVVKVTLRAEYTTYELREVQA